MLAVGDSALRKEADTMTFVGCDLHTRMQQVAVLDTRTGEVGERQLAHDASSGSTNWGGIAMEIPRGSKDRLKVASHN
jgi:hypothetical protein